MRHNACVNDGGMYDGFYLDTLDEPLAADLVEAWGIVSPGQCMLAGGTGPHAVCVLNDPWEKVSALFGGPAAWPNWGAECKEHEQCDTALNSGEGRCTQALPKSGWTRPICEGGKSCMMSQHSGKQYWCDASSHVHFDDKGVSLSHNESLLQRAWNNPNMHSAEDYNCWDQAKSIWGGLQFNGQYAEDIGLPPNDGDPDFCTWNVPDYTDMEALADWSMIVIDASGSMGTDANGTPGWVYAVDGAEYFNQVAVAKGRKAGVYAFGKELWPLQWADVLDNKVQAPQPGTHEMVLGDPIDLGPTAVDLYSEGVGTYVADNNGTNLCAVLEGAKDSFEQAGAPAGDREVVLLTDARFSLYACRDVASWVIKDPSIAGQICAEAGMRVNVISTGATPDMELAQWLADSCGGWHFYAGDEQAASGSFPHAAKVYAAMSKAIVAGDGVALHERALLDAESETASHSFAVPAGATGLDAAWIGGAYALADADGFESPAFDSLDFVLESPSGILSSPIKTDSELDARHRRVSIAAPEPGLWTMHVDASALGSGSRSRLDVGWLASVEHPGYQAEAWVEQSVWNINDEVTILGSMIHGEYGVGALKVAARISALGQSWELPMVDDGRHGDGVANDGVYAAQFVAKIPGPYAVKLDYEVIPGISHTIPGESIFGSGPGSTLLSDSASLVAHTSFTVHRNPVEVLAALPQLQVGKIHSNLSATLEGRLVPWPGVSVSLGEGVVVRDLAVRCVNCPDAGGNLDPEELVYELRFNAEVATDAPLTERDLLVEIGEADYRVESATSVVSGMVDDDGGTSSGDEPPPAGCGATAGCGVTEIGGPFSRLGASFALAIFMLLGLGLGLRSAKIR